MLEPALALDRLCKSFGGHRVTRDVSFALAAGARHALIGPNGAGKTTLINQITGILQPSSGSIRLFGTDITCAPPERRVRLGLVRTFQISSLFPDMTVNESVALAAVSRAAIDWCFWPRSADAMAVAARVGDVLGTLALEDVADRKVKDLAYGERRLVEMALALALEPKVLLLDEPAAGLSRRDGDRLLDVLQRLPKEIVVIIIEHDMDLVFQFAEEITVLMEGAILTRGRVSEIRSDRRVRDIYLGRRNHV
jgi:branched-chain amino acid transport system ATP-binding protein